jgi:hypothetical protein
LKGLIYQKILKQTYQNYQEKYRYPQADTVVLYSCSQRANKGRKRYKRKGQTSSVYRSESLGGEQMGTLVNTFGIRQGPAFFDSISDQKMNTLNPLIRKYMPHNTPIFTDMDTGHSRERTTEW